MLAEITVQEVITYKKIIKITEDEFNDFLIDYPDTAIDIYSGYMSLDDIVNFEYTNPKVEEYKK